MKIEEEILKKKKVNIDKLLEYGFKKDNDSYVYKLPILDGAFKMEVFLDNNQVLTGKLFEKDFEDEEYTNYRIEGVKGDYVGQIKQAFIDVISDIAASCYEDELFIYPQANRIASKIKQIYGDDPEFLWEGYDHGVFRNNANKKWYGIIMQVKENKIISDGDKNKIIEVMNVKLNEEHLSLLLTKPNYYKAYHMAKGSWITFILNESIKDEEIIELIKESYAFTIQSSDWVIPVNTKYFDVIDYFDNAFNNEANWEQNNDIRVGDNIYIYVSVPYSSIMYKGKVIEAIKKDSKKKLTFIRVKMERKYDEKKYTLERLTPLGLKTVRGARSLPKEIVSLIEKEK